MYSEKMRLSVACYDNDIAVLESLEGTSWFGEEATISLLSSHLRRNTKLIFWLLSLHNVEII